MQPIHLLTINIEQFRHLDTIQTTIQERQPDIICLQEVLEQDFSHFQTSLNLSGVFAPMIDITSAASNQNRIGVAILTRGTIEESDKAYYGNFFAVPHTNPTPGMGMASDCVLLTARCQVEDSTVTVGTTHFTWSPDGEVIDYQIKNVERLIANAQKYDDLILCGDFNSLRGKAVFDRLAEVFQDTIPPHITSTIDPTLHRAGPLQYVVDGLFSTGDYTVDNVEILTGISDHCGIAAEITLTGEGL